MDAETVWSEMTEWIVANIGTIVGWVAAIGLGIWSLGMRFGGWGQSEKMETAKIREIDKRVQKLEDNHRETDKVATVMDHRVTSLEASVRSIVIRTERLPVIEEKLNDLIEMAKERRS